ncbi:hypothetical protein DEV92_105151 [Phyllobacterium myrsinacearum]|nr:hypothetical protein DEV92_105151 [Phyllobacterium myrsinacearum]
MAATDRRWQPRGKWPRQGQRPADRPQLPSARRYALVCVRWLASIKVAIIAMCAVMAPRRHAAKQQAVMIKAVNPLTSRKIQSLMPAPTVSHAAMLRAFQRSARMPKGNGTSKLTSPASVKPRPISRGAKPDALEKNKAELEKYTPAATAPIVWAIASPRTVLSAGKMGDGKTPCFNRFSGYRHIVRSPPAAAIPKCNQQLWLPEPLHRLSQVHRQGLSSSSSIGLSPAQKPTSDQTD